MRRLKGAGLGGRDGVGDPLRSGTLRRRRAAEAGPAPGKRVACCPFTIILIIPSRRASPDPRPPSMLLHPPQPSSSLAHYAYHPQHAPLHPRQTPRALTVDRLQPFPVPAPDEQHLDDSPLESDANYSYVPRGHPVRTPPSSETMYQHSVHSHFYDEHQNTHSNQHQPPPDYDVQSRQHPPSIHTENLLYPDPNLSPSPASSPADNSIVSQSQSARQLSFPQPMSAPHTQNAFPPRFGQQSGMPRLAFSNPTLDRRMSEPVLGQGRQAYPQPPPPTHHDTFAYSAASSATTMVQPSPLSPRPSSSSYSSYGTYPEHQRDDGGASLESGIADPYSQPVSAAWGSGLKTADLEECPLSSSPLSPLYAGSVASGSDVSATGLPSPPPQSHSSPAKQPAPISGLRPPPQGSAGGTPRTGGNNSKTYSFVSLPGNAVKKRPRRRYDEIERLYQCKCVASPVIFAFVHRVVPLMSTYVYSGRSIIFCTFTLTCDLTMSGRLTETRPFYDDSWPNCSKAYGTLNHLNAHVTMQRHGSKRSPNGTCFPNNSASPAR